MAEEEQDKQHEPSQKKLDDARKRGEVPRSQDLTGAISYATILLTFVAIGPWITTHFGDIGVTILSSLGTPGATRAYLGSPLHAISLGNELAEGVLAVLAPPALIVLLSLLAQRSLTFAPTKLAPKLSRISVISNAKNKFGRSGLFEFFKSALKLTIISAVLAIFLSKRMDEIAVSMMATAGGVAQIMGDLAIDFLTIVVIVFGLIGAVDLIWQFQACSQCLEDPSLSICQ